MKTIRTEQESKELILQFYDKIEKIAEKLEMNNIEFASALTNFDDKEGVFTFFHFIKPYKDRALKHIRVIEVKE